MQTLIAIGAALTLAGIAGLVWSALVAMRARREGLDDAALRERLRRAVVLNMGALFLSVFGLIAVIAGIMLR